MYCGFSNSVQFMFSVTMSMDDINLSFRKSLFSFSFLNLSIKFILQSVHKARVFIQYLLLFIY